MTCYLAARGGHLHVLKWARKYGCPWDALVSYDAAESGQLELLKWAQEHRCPWYEDLNDDCCALAAQGGHLKVLRWLREHGRGLHSSTFQLNLSRF